MAKTHDAILILKENANLIEVEQMACAEAKAKNKIPYQISVKPVWYVQSPFGHVIIVELPLGVEVKKSALEVQGKKQA